MHITGTMDQMKYPLSHYTEYLNGGQQWMLEGGVAEAQTVSSPSAVSQLLVLSSYAPLEPEAAWMDTKRSNTMNFSMNAAVLQSDQGFGHQHGVLQGVPHYNYLLV